MSNDEMLAGGPGAKLTDFQRGYLKALHDIGQKPDEIAARMKICR